MLTKLKSFYEGKKVFITGHTGFKGAWLTFWLYSLGANVKGYALAPVRHQDLFNQMNGDSLCTSVIGDIRDQNRLETELLSFQPDIVFHLAAQPLVIQSYNEPELTYETNVMGTAYLLKSIKALNKKCTCVLITTDKVYENKEWYYPYREEDVLGGYDPYSSSKAASELLIKSYRASFFNIKDFDKHKKAIAVARAGNVIGGGDWSDNRIIPDIIRALMIKNKVSVRNPHAVRPWQHVLEPLGGYLLLGMNLDKDPIAFSEAWNFGPLLADTFSVESLVKKAIAIWGEGVFEIHNSDIKLHEAGLLRLDISKAQAMLSWKPTMTCDQAIQMTINWYKNIQTENAIVLMEADINQYLTFANA